MDSDALGRYGRLVEELLTVPLCITWIEDLPVTDVLTAAGQQEEDGLSHRTYVQTVEAAYDAIPAHVGAAMAGTLGNWTVLVEPNGFQGSRTDVLSRLSAAGRALSVFWNANGDGQIAYAERGQVLAVVDLFDPEDVEDLPVALSVWTELAEEDDPRVAGLALGEAVTGRRLDAEWLATEHLSTVLDALPDTAGESWDEQERLAHLAYLATDPRVADLVANPDPGRTREIAALVAETACELSGLDVPLAGRLLAALEETSDSVMLAELRAEVRSLSEELRVQSPDVGAPRSMIDHWHSRYTAVSVLEAAVEEDSGAAARDAIWRIGMLRLDDRGGRRMGTLKGVLEQIQASTRRA